VRSTGLAGAGVAVLAITVLVGGVLFGLRLMPGPAFGSGALLTLVAAMVVQRRRAGTRLLPGIRFPARFDPLIVLGVVAGMGGLAIAFHAA
jgi:hypothetical protein